MIRISRRDALATFGASLLWSSCARQQDASDPTAMPDDRDVHSFSRPDQVRVRDVALDLAVSFEDRTLSGTAVLQTAAPATGLNPLLLDTRDLSIDTVETSSDGAMYAATEWQVGDRDPILGSPLTVKLPSSTRFVRVRYGSVPQASGLQWLDPAQTAGKRQPFLYSQNQSIHARSWIPIQDSPGVRITYSARIRVPQDLVAQGMTALMSAEHRGAANGVFEFVMDQPIPSYLIALAVGDLQFAEVGPRTGVYAEPSVLPKAAAEFSDMEKMVAAVEGLYGPYRWDRYDLLILPPSFPYGGMENPRLTFATPTVIAGDKSLVGLVSHELAHSWSGNLVTNATWGDFWLNEGFTTYIENRIQEVVYGPDLAVMERVLARRTLDKELMELPPAEQILHIDLKGKDPDEAVTSIPYNKGALLLHQMENVFGRDIFDAYLKRYFAEFAFQSITTKTMLAYLKRELFDPYPAQAARIPIEEWVYEPGLPASAPRALSQRLQAVEEDAEAFAAGTRPAGQIQTAQWSTQEWLEFLQSLPPMTSAQMAELDRAFHLTDTGNSEMLDVWLRMAITAQYRPADARLEAFLIEVGRMKYLRPLYTELMKTPEGQERARAIYAQARPGYHPIAQTAMDKIVRASAG